MNGFLICQKSTIFALIHSTHYKRVTKIYKMPKYRRLSIEEIQSLEKEFIDFLVVNGIPADDWQKIKTNNPEKAEGIIDSFSDVVFEKILRQNKYLVRHGKEEMATVSCLSDRFHMIAIRYQDENKNTVEDIYTSMKKYNSDRESEIWSLLENQGFELSDGKEYLSLIEKIK